MIFGKILFPCISEPITGYESVWIIGDDFMNNTYNRHFVHRVTDRMPYIKENFNVASYYNSDFDAFDMNAYSRLRNLFVKAIKEKVLFPKMVIIIPDDNLAKYFNQNSPGVSKQLGRCRAMKEKVMA